MPWDGALVRFGEIGIKSAPVRRRMLDRLQQNLLDSLLRAGVEGNAQRHASRLWMVGPDVDALVVAAQRTFGVVSVSPARVVAADIPAMGTAAAELALEREWSSFAVRARREGGHDFSSGDVGRDVGSAIWKAAEAAGRTPAVDLSAPDLEVHFDIRQKEAYVYTDVLAGPGGLPMGTQGKVMALVSDRASFVAAWLMMRRGCRVVPAFFGHAQALPTDNLEALQAWGMQAAVDCLPVCTGFAPKREVIAAAQQLARRAACVALVTGDRLDSDLVVSPGDVPVLRPVCGMPAGDVEALAERIGLDDDEPEHIFADDASETVESLLAMHRIVEA